MPFSIRLAVAAAALVLASGSQAAECTTAEGMRVPFTLEEQNAARIAGIPDARFFAEDVETFLKSVPEEPGPWLAISGGGADGAYSAGILNGWTARGDRPDFSVITGISTGAAIAPFAFLGKAYDKTLLDNYTTINAGDIFEDIDTDQSLLDTWPLKDLIARQATFEIMQAVAEEHRKGRRLYVVTMNLDSERRVVWNLGAIASKGDEAALALFRDVILASSSVPGLFPPVTIDLDASGKCVREVHIDGSVGGPFYVAPRVWFDGKLGERLPASALYVMLNAKRTPYFEIVQQNILALTGRAISIALKFAGRVDAERSAAAARRDDIPFGVAYIADDFDEISQGAFDDAYMKKLFERGESEAKTGKAFRPDLAAD